MKKKANIAMLSFLFVIFSISIYSQGHAPPTPPRGSGNNNRQGDGKGGPPPPPGLPIDFGISALFISGAAFGVYALKKKNKQ